MVERQVILEGQELRVCRVCLVYQVSQLVLVVLASSIRRIDRRPIGQCLGRLGLGRGLGLGQGRWELASLGRRLLPLASWSCWRQPRAAPTSAD